MIALKLLIVQFIVVIFQLMLMIYLIGKHKHF